VQNIISYLQHRSQETDKGLPKGNGTGKGQWWLKWCVINNVSFRTWFGRHGRLAEERISFLEDGRDPETSSGCHLFIVTKNYIIKATLSVIPAEAGIQRRCFCRTQADSPRRKSRWIPGQARNDNNETLLNFQYPIVSAVGS